MKRTVATRIALKLLTITCALLAVHLVFQYLNLNVYDQKQGQIYELSNRVDMDDEVSLATWLAQFLLLAIAAAAWLAAKFETDSGRKKAWWVVGLISLLLSIDEVGAIHEFIIQSVYLAYYNLAPAGSTLDAWWLVLPVVILGGGWLAWWLAKTLPARTISQIVMAGAVFMSGAIALELLGNDIDKSTFWHQGLAVGLEETLEMIGSIIGLYAIVDYLEKSHSDKLGRFQKALTGKV